MATPSRNKGATAPGTTAPAAQPQPDPRLQWRDFLDQVDTCALALEGLLELATPYTAEEGDRATLLRSSVSFALRPAVLALRQSIEAGWVQFKEGAVQ